MVIMTWLTGAVSTNPLASHDFKNATWGVQSVLLHAYKITAHAMFRDHGTKQCAHATVTKGYASFQAAQYDGLKRVVHFLD